MKNSRGFSLLELMIAVAIIGVLAAIAIPTYGDYLIKARIPDAMSNLANKRIQMEQTFQDNQTYVGAGGCNSDSSSSQYFTFSCTGGDAPTVSTYKITATGTGPMAGFSYTIDQSNTKTSTIVAPAKSSWIASSTSCWITKAGGAC